MASSDCNFLQGGGDMGALMRKLDWSGTPIGAAQRWPQSLRTAVSMCLNSRFPILLWWGPELVMLYNDAYRPMLGNKHPNAMGQRGAECWAEIWHIIGPMLEGVLHEGSATWSEDQMLPLDRRGFVEECFFTFTYSPIRDESGGIGGVFCAVVETSQRVIEERRLRLLKALSDDAALASTEQDAYQRVATTLRSARDDVSFALLYTVDDDVQSASAALCGTAGLRCEVSASSAALLVGEGAPWPIARVLQTRTHVLLDRHEVDLSSFAVHAWPEHTRRAVLMPLWRAGHERPHGFALFGVSPRLVYDASYERFFALLGSHLSQAVANACAREQEQKRLAALAALDRAKTEFFSNVSHEFRTPLTLALAPTEDALRSEARVLHGEALELVHRNQLRLLKLVNTLLDFSRIEAGRAEARYEPTDLAVLTADLASSFRSVVERGGLALEVSCPPLPEPVYVDRDMWEKIVLNLLSNAFKFTLEGRIGVRLAVDDGRVALSVSDTGVGIANDQLPRVFERFHRIEGTRSRTHEGTGIGLALVRDLVALQGGEIDVQSTPGVGSTFTVTLPLGRAHLPAERVHGTTTPVSTPIRAESFVSEALRWVSPAERDDELEVREDLARDRDAEILVADDNADMREYIVRLLGSRWRVTAVADGAEALAAVARRRPELVLADVMMPRVDGCELVRRLRANPDTRSIPIVLLSARAGEEATAEGLLTGADDYLTKPFSAAALLARIESQLSLARTRAEAQQRVQEAKAAADAARREAERAAADAERANRLKDEFLATLSHELRTPLNAIIGWAAMLNAHPESLPERVQKGIDVIERNARAQAKIIEDVLDISSIVMGKLAIDARPMDLVTVVQDAMDAVRHAAATKKLHLALHIDDASFVLHGDPGRLRQVAWNLLTNAIRHTSAGGRVDVRLHRADDWFELSVEDTGSGIHPDFLPHVWDRFRQADSSMARAHGGLGLGLAIVKSVVVDLHGGEVEARSDGSGRGAVFRVRLPALRTPQRAALHHTPTRREPELRTPGSGRPLAGRHVLLVEDEEDSRELMHAALTRFGARVSVAASAHAALAVLAGEIPDLLITDIGMPERDGYWLIEQVRRAYTHTRLPAIALTAYTRPVDRERAAAAGFARHVPKPVDLATLSHVALEVLASATTGDGSARS